jgi:hypothetical protein
MQLKIVDRPGPAVDVYDLDILQTVYNGLEDIQIPVLVFTGKRSKLDEYLASAVADAAETQARVAMYEAIIELLEES